MTKLPDMLIWYIADHGNPRSIDGVYLDNEGVHRGLYSGETLEEIGRRYANPRLTTFDEFTEAHDAAYRSEPKEITEDRFYEMLNVLPPLGYAHSNGAESFKMCEMLSGAMTDVFARVGNRFWSFVDKRSIPHDEIIRKCVKAMEEATC